MVPPFSSCEAITSMSRRKASPLITRLTQYLVVKSILELLFVISLAVSFFLTVFTPSLSGVVEDANAEHVTGWISDAAARQSYIEVQLYIDDHFTASSVIGRERSGIKTAKDADESRHGFRFDTPPLAQGEHEASVYVARESRDQLRLTLQLIGKPQRFAASANGVVNSKHEESPASK